MARRPQLALPADFGPLGKNALHEHHFPETQGQGATAESRAAAHVERGGGADTSRSRRRLRTRPPVRPRRAPPRHALRHSPVRERPGRAEEAARRPQATTATARRRHGDAPRCDECARHPARRPRPAPHRDGRHRQPRVQFRRRPAERRARERRRGRERRDPRSHADARAARATREPARLAARRARERHSRAGAERGHSSRGAPREPRLHLLLLRRARRPLRRPRISHGDGYVTRYAHNQRTLVAVGQMVKRGESVALMGSTGRSTGPHVHFEVLRNGRQVNPLSFIGH
ncbi:MAG: M23 family metallopeptidase [Gammaproteobacteria bacterium]|nr:MAG: M23 family metallopeptidase [Gammaproteobacteria bacterium]